MSTEGVYSRDMGKGNSREGGEGLTSTVAESDEKERAEQNGASCGRRPPPRSRGERR